MAGRIPQAFIDEVVARSDIVEIIGPRVPLKKSGREYKACCPFHSEKSPSFWVSPDKQFYHCFGCGAHGTVVGFLMQYEKLGFLDAVADLAQRAGLELPREAQTPHEPGGVDLYQVMADASRFFEQNWQRQRARPGLSREARGIDAIHERAIRPGICARFVERAAQSIRRLRGGAPPPAPRGPHHRARSARRRRGASADSMIDFETA